MRDRQGFSPGNGFFSCLYEKNKDPQEVFCGSQTS